MYYLGTSPLICGICYNVQDHLARSFNILTTTAMVGGTFHIWRHICLVQYALWPEIWQICRLGVFCVNFLCRLRTFGMHIFARSWWLEVQKHVKGLGLLGQELFVDQRMYECEKEVESLV